MQFKLLFLILGIVISTVMILGAYVSPIFYILALISVILSISWFTNEMKIFYRHFKAKRDLKRNTKDIYIKMDQNELFQTILDELKSKQDSSKTDK